MSGRVLACGCVMGTYWLNEVIKDCGTHDQPPPPSEKSSDDIHEYAEQRKIGREIADQIERDRRWTKKG